ncbi:MAG: LUD domain-containing protein [Halobacteriales archaeon]
MSKARDRKAARIRELLETEGDAVFDNTTLFNDQRVEITAGFDRYQELREQARSIKEDAIEQLPTLIDELEAAVEANGGTLYLADTPADANRYIAEVADDIDAETAVKSKSMTTEEIEVNDHLASKGVDVYETDLGEFVIQVADEAPSHIVGPAIHKSTDEIATLFNEQFDPETPFETAEELTRFARDYLGERIREADLGMTGANFVMAESGSIAIVTNEGNARKCAVTPDTHVAVAGIEKIIPSIEELGPFIELIAKTATGQAIAQYVSVLSPPTDSPQLDFESPDVAGFGSAGENDDREFHLVLIDNGRFDMREDDDLRETLYCIRCGACANSCANFQHVGGHAFGGETYSGGIGTGWEAGIEGLDVAAEFNDLCTGCSRCVPACPVKIDIPWINTVVRDRINDEADPSAFDFLVDGLSPDIESAGTDIQKRFFGNFETLAKVGSKTAPVSNWLAGTDLARGVMERFIGIDRRRELPEFQRETFVEWFADRGPRINDPERQAVVYPDVYTNHVQVERGKAAVRVLEALGVEVTVPAVGESGRAPLSQGMLSTAERKASAVHSGLVEHIDDGRDVIVIEPSDLGMFRREYEKLLPEQSAQRMAENSYEILEYIYGMLEHDADPDRLDRTAAANGLAYHSHCQMRTLGLDVYTEAVFDRLEYDVVTSDVECCGMAGSFGYKSEYYELSMDVGEPLAEQFADHTDRTIVASGTSCMEQIESLLAEPVTHPVEVLDPWS